VTWPILAVCGVTTFLNVILFIATRKRAVDAEIAAIKADGSAQLAEIRAEAAEKLTGHAQAAVGHAQGAARRAEAAEDAANDVLALVRHMAAKPR
jgi:hypothetical protein